MSLDVNNAINFDGGSDVVSLFGQTSFRGFLYSPTRGHSVAWSVSSDKLFNGTAVKNFPVIYVNSGVWSSSSSSVTSTNFGTYYFEI